MEQDIITETILGIYLYQSPKAIKVLLVSGSTIWIPKSLVRNLEEVEISNFEDYQELEVDRWFVETNKLEIEL